MSAVSLQDSGASTASESDSVTRVGHSWTIQDDSSDDGSGLGISRADLLPSGAITYNGNPSYGSTGKAHIDYFAGVTRQTSDTEISRLAQACIESDLRLAVATFFQKRDCRGGAGERKPFLLSMKELPGSLRRRLYSVASEYGYWDDLNAFARMIPEDQAIIASLFATQLLNNMIGFGSALLHRPLEKWLPTEKQQDDRSWGAVKKIIRAFNRQDDKKSEGVVLKGQVILKLGRDFQAQIKKIDPQTKVVPSQKSCWAVEEVDPWSDEISIKITEVCRRFDHIFKKAQALPNEISRLTLTDYRKWCSFMRAYYEVVEHYKSEDHWDLIDFSKVPSIAFNRTKEQFQKHTPDRFAQFMKKVQSGQEKINVGRLMPFELLSQESNEVRDTQWRLVVEETKKFYKEVPLDNIFHPRNTIHVADVSGSMCTTGKKPEPLDIALSLALLGAEVGQKALYTFSSTPQRYEPTWTSLTEAQQIVQDSNYTTNFKALIDRIHQDGVPGSIFVYTDGGFDQMCRVNPITAADYLTEKFGENAPTIVFWNVAGNVKDFATTTQHEKIIQVAGFSKDLYEIFTRLTSTENISLETFFRKAVLTDRYEIPLAIYDQWREEEDNSSEA